jgi:hypothetical protein
MVWRWTGDNAFRDQMYAFTKKNMQYMIGLIKPGDPWPAGATVHQVTLNGSVAHYTVRDTNAGREVLVSTPCRGQTWRVHVVAG